MFPVLHPHWQSADEDFPRFAVHIEYTPNMVWSIKLPDLTSLILSVMITNPIGSEITFVLFVASCFHRQSADEDINLEDSLLYIRSVERLQDVHGFDVCGPSLDFRRVYGVVPWQLTNICAIWWRSGRGGAGIYYRL